MSLVDMQPAPASTKTRIDFTAKQLETLKYALWLAAEYEKGSLHESYDAEIAKNVKAVEALLAKVEKA